MLYATVMHPPVMGSTVKSVDNKETLAVKGRERDGDDSHLQAAGVNMQALGGVAVLADSTWAAMQDGEAKGGMDESAHKVFNSGPYRKELEETARKPGKLFAKSGTWMKDFPRAEKVIEAEYYAPLLAHASMEPRQRLRFIVTGKSRCGRLRRVRRGTGCDCGGGGREKKRM